MSDLTEHAGTDDRPDEASATGRDSTPNRPWHATEVSASEFSASSTTAAVLALLSVPHLDTGRIRRLVDVRAGRRLRRRRGLLGVAAAVVTLGITIAVWPRPEPQEISADRDQSTSTSSTTTTTTTPPADMTTVPVTTMTSVSTTTTAAVTTVPTTAPTTTVPPNKPMTVQAELLDGATMVPTSSPVAGQTVVLRVRWNDPDLTDPTLVDVNAEFGDPLVTRPIVATPRPTCERVGGGASAMVDIPFRYSSVNTPTIQVEVTACDGAGPFGERITTTVPVKVAAPATGSRIVVLAGVEGDRQPDAGEVVAGASVTPKRTPELPLVLTSDGSPATVAPVPATHAGGLLLRWQPTVCQPSATPATITAGTETLRVVLGPTSSNCSPTP